MYNTLFNYYIMPVYCLTLAHHLLSYILFLAIAMSIKILSLESNNTPRYLASLTILSGFS